MAVWSEVTSLEVKRQSKPFINLNRGSRWWTASKKKVPPFGRTFLCSRLGGKLAPLARVLALARILAGVLALTVRVLLLLAGLAAAALLLAGLLARILILLTRLLVLIGHRNLPGWTWSSRTKRKPTREQGRRFDGNRHLTVSECSMGEPTLKLPLYKPLKPHLPLLPRKGFHC
jgi:hypothetical protein